MPLSHRRLTASQVAHKVHTYFAPELKSASPSAFVPRKSLVIGLGLITMPAWAKCKQSHALLL